MVSSEGRDGVQYDNKPAVLPRHLLTTLLVTALVLMGVWLLHLTKRVTQMELSLASAPTVQAVGEHASGPPQGMGEAPPWPMGDEPGSGSVDAAAAEGGAPPMGSGPPGGARGPGEGRGGAPGMDRAPDDETFEARRVSVLEGLAAYLDVSEFDAETEQALRDEVDRTFEAMVETRSGVADGKISERERRVFLQAERGRVVQNIQDILGKDEASIFLEEVMGVSEQALRRMEQRRAGEDPPEE